MYQHFTGSAAEHYAASRFLEWGCEIFWPTITQSRADFIVCHQGQFSRIQVKKATWNKVGPFRYLQCRLVSRNSSRKSAGEGVDFVVIVDDLRIWLIPAADIKRMTSICLDSNGPRKAYSRKRYDPAKWRIV